MEQRGGQDGEGAANGDRGRGVPNQSDDPGNETSDSQKLGPAAGNGEAPEKVGGGATDIKRRRARDEQKGTDPKKGGGEDTIL